MESGLTNASMEFDVATLRPTYRLSIGIPGKSNAFEISRRLGLFPHIIEAARARVSREDVRFEDAILKAETHRQKAYRERTEAEAMRKEVQSLKKEIERQKRELEAQKEKMLREAKKKAKAVLDEAKSESEALITELKAAADEADAKSVNRAIQKTRDALRQKREQLEETEAQRELPGEPPKNLRPGERVKLVKLNQTGTVLTAPDGRGEVQVQVGIMKVTAKVADLIRVEEPPDPGAGRPGVEGAGAGRTPRRWAWWWMSGARTWTMRS